MNQNRIFFILAAVFLLIAIVEISIFTTMGQAKWFDNGLDIFSGIVLLFLGTKLLSIKTKIKPKSVKYTTYAIFIMATGKLFEILLQEWQISINYQYPEFFGYSTGLLLWGISDVVVTVAIILLFIGLREVAK